MKIVINKRFEEQNVFFGKVFKSELTIDLATKKIEYYRVYIPFDIEKPTVEDKVEYRIDGILNVSESKFNFLNELLNKIKENNIGVNVITDKNNTLDYLNHIDLNIDGQNYIININSIEYEMLVHLSTFEIFDNNEIEYIKKNTLPIPKENM